MVTIFEYSHFSKGDIIVAGSGTVRPYVLEQTDRRVRFRLLHIPNYVGTVADQFGVPGKIDFEIELPAGFDTLTLAIQGSACPEPPRLSANGITKPVQSDAVEFSGLHGIVRLTVEEVGSNCYVVFKDIFTTGTGRTSPAK